MTTLDFPNVFLPGTPILSDEVNDNFQAVKTWVGDGIDNAHLTGTAGITAENLAAALLDQLGVTANSVVRGGKCNIATEEVRSNTAFATLTTPDQVDDVVLPTDGLLLVGYQAMWKESVSGAARAGLFLGATQTQVAGQAGLYTGAAGATDGGTANRYAPLASFPGGLCSVKQGTPYVADATTGQALGVFSEAPTFSATTDVGGATYDLPAPSLVGGFWIGHAAAGTYDVSVQFRASSGSVTVKNRKLWVRTWAF